MKFYIYSTVDNAVVATFTGDTNEDCERQADAAGYMDNDDYGGTYSPAFDAIDGLKHPAAVALGSIKSPRKAKSSAANGAKGGRPVHTWRGECQVGIYERCEWIVRLYSDRAIYTQPYVRWVGNTGGYAERKIRIDASECSREWAAIRKIREQEIADEADYTERVRAVIWDL